MPKKTDPRVDAYIKKSAPFAQPILEHFRALVHQACPDAEEAIKWGHAFFILSDVPMCNMAAFKAHVSLGFWHQGMTKVLADSGLKLEADSAMGAFGRVTSLGDLPKDKTILGFIREAAKLNESGAPARAAAKPKAALPMPADLGAVLKANKTAAANFEKLPPSHRREYLEWITEAKREETRQKRIATTIEWVTEGKSRNWKYENC